MLSANNHPLQADVSVLTEMTREAMIERWEQGLVTPMSSTITTFAKTDGSWWTATQIAWQRIPQDAQSERLDFHHERFGSVRQAKGPGTSAERCPWSLR